jgi:hypothetical protein
VIAHAVPVILYQGRDQWFFLDEWGFSLEPQRWKSSASYSRSPGRPGRSFGDSTARQPDWPFAALGFVVTTGHARATGQALAAGDVQREIRQNADDRSGPLDLVVRPMPPDAPVERCR